VLIPVLTVNTLTKIASALPIRRRPI
jgi:hypothetical protein